MPRGGKREGAGRQPGSITKFAKHAREQARATGQLPHEFLLSIVRGEEVDGVVPKLDQRIDAAKAAAPYFAPKMTTAEVTVTDNPLKQLFDQIHAGGRKGLIHDK